MRPLFKLLTGLFGLLFTLAAIIAGWGFVEGRTMDVQHQLGPVRDLPPSLEGRQIVVMSDLQVGMWLDNVGVIERMVTQIVQSRPTAVLLPGDFVYGHGPDDPDASDELAEVQALLRPITEAGIPTYAVLGNHDYAQRQPAEPTNVDVAAHVTAALEEIGIVVLHNSADRLPLGGELYIVGIGPHGPKEANPEQAFAGVPDGAARVVMMHHPDTFPTIDAGKAPLAVAGHTHGGQMAIPGTPDWSWLSAVWSGEVAADGWIEDYGREGNRLYVTRGVGFSVVPLRVFAPPELTWFTLTASDPLAAR